MATQSKFFADLGIKSATNTEIDGNLSVSGNLTVSGTQTTIDSTTKSVADSMIELASGNTTADLTDIGIYGNYNDGLSGESGVSEYTGLFRDATDSTWKLYDGLEVEPTTTVNTSGSGYTLADLQVGDLTATTLTATNTLTGGSMTYPTSDGTNGQVLKTNGSGTLSFGDAASTDGITASGSNTIIQSPDDTSVAYINNTGYFGINHDNPTGRLHVAGHTSGVASIFESNGNGDTVPLQLKVKANNGTTSTQGLYGNAGSVSTDNTITLGSSPTSGLVVAGDGKVGIGMTPAHILDIYRSDAGDAALSIKSSSSGDPTIHLDSALSNRSGIINFKDQGTITGAIKYHHQTDIMEFHTTATERFRLSADDAHIGMNGNDVQLFLGSTGGAFGGNSTNNVRASGSSLMLNTPGQFIVEKSGSTGILMDTDKSFYVRPATSADNFGMYVRTSNSADTGMKIGRTGTNNAEMGIKVSSQSSNSFASFKFAISDQTSWSSDDWFKLKVSGEMDGNFNDTSDQNLKENIVSIPNGDLAKVMQLNPVTFDWKNAVSRNDQTGFVAQEVETIFPNEVLGDAYDVEVEGSGKSINTIGLLSHTVKALQELKTLVDALETRIATLES